MLHTKFCKNWPAGSGEEDILRVFTICGRGGHLGHVTQMPLTNFPCPYPRTFDIKFGFDCQAVLGKKIFKHCGRRRTPDHEYPISSPRLR